MALVPRGEHSLYDDLVRTTIPDTQNRRAEKDAGPWKICIRRRLDHVEVIGRHHRSQMFETADASESDDSKGDGACNQDQSLHGVRIDDRGQTAGNGINAG